MMFQKMIRWKIKITMIAPIIVIIDMDDDNNNNLIFPVAVTTLYTIPTINWMTSLQNMIRVLVISLMLLLQW
jgi:hypothetical protein